MGCVPVTEPKKLSLFDILRNAPAERKTETFKNVMTEITMAQRWPQNAVLELLPLCNLKCKMCYVRRDPEEAARLGGVISGREWCSIADQCFDLGVLNFTLTGGECMLHPDFFDIYNHIYDHTPFITLMTNAGLITEEHIALFRRRTPYRVVITVYGSSRETYQNLCGNASAYDRVMQSLKMLRENSIPFYIQMTVVKENVNDVPQVMQLANEMGVQFQYMDSLTCYDNATPETQQNESADHALVIEKLGKPTRSEEQIQESRRQIEKTIARRRAKLIPPRSGIPCNAARNTLVINWRGFMQPCTVLDAYQANVRRESLRAAWLEMVSWADSLTVLPECYTCIHITKCVSCMAQHYNDTHEFGKPSPRLCWKMKHPEEAARLEAEFAAREAELLND